MFIISYGADLPRSTEHISSFHANFDNCIPI